MSVGASVTHLAMFPAATLQSMSALKREALALLEYWSALAEKIVSSSSGRSKTGYILRRSGGRVDTATEPATGWCQHCGPTQHELRIVYTPSPAILRIGEPQVEGIAYDVAQGACRLSTQILVIVTVTEIARTPGPMPSVHLIPHGHASVLKVAAQLQIITGARCSMTVRR